MKRTWVTLTSVAVIGVGAWAAEGPERVKPNADLRYRYQYTDDDAAPDTREQHRIRARAGLTAEVNPELDLILQLATGEDKGGAENPTSSNVTLTDGASGKGVYLDLAAFDWHPERVKGLHLLGGKMRLPFVAVSDLIWDTDVNPEGLALNCKVGADLCFEARGGLFQFMERRDGDDTQMVGAQAAVGFKPAKDVKLLAGVSGYIFDPMEGCGLIDWEEADKAYGNTTERVVVGEVTNALYANDYAEVEGFARAEAVLVVPVAVYGSYVVNTEADEDDAGFLAGITLGKAKEPGSVELDYSYFRLEKDAVVGAFTDGDRWNGGTDGKGHKLGLRYQAMDNVQLAGAVFVTEKVLDNPVDFLKAQIDLTAKF